MKTFVAFVAVSGAFGLTVPAALADPPISPSCWGAAKSAFANQRPVRWLSTLRALRGSTARRVGLGAPKSATSRGSSPAIIPATQLRHSASPARSLRPPFAERDAQPDRPWSMMEAAGID
jgi:hypothetical protein